MDKQYAWVAYHQTNDTEGAVVATSYSLLALQAYILGRAGRKLRSYEECEVHRYSRRNIVYINIRAKYDILRVFECYTIRRVQCI